MWKLATLGILSLFLCWAVDDQIIWRMLHVFNGRSWYRGLGIYYLLLAVSLCASLQSYLALVSQPMHAH